MWVGEGKDFSSILFLCNWWKRRKYELLIAITFVLTPMLAQFFEFNSKVFATFKTEGSPHSHLNVSFHNPLRNSNRCFSDFLCRKLNYWRDSDVFLADSVDFADSSDFRADSWMFFWRYVGKIENGVWAHRRARGAERRPEWGAKRRTEAGAEPRGPGGVPRHHFQSCPHIVKKHSATQHGSPSYSAKSTLLSQK